MITRILFATGNEGKMKEVRMLLKELEIPVLSLKEAGIEVEIEETGSTFEENAIIKARTISEVTGDLVLADDSGLEVDFLDKEPGVYSARYLGENTSYSVKNDTIIERLKGACGEERSARFVCAIAAVLPDKRILTTVGTMEGQIAQVPLGDGGFGYDPILFLPELGKTAAQLTIEEKNEVSHRGRALAAMKTELLKVMRR